MEKECTSSIIIYLNLGIKLIYIFFSIFYLYSLLIHAVFHCALPTLNGLLPKWGKLNINNL